MKDSPNLHPWHFVGVFPILRRDQNLPALGADLVNIGRIVVQITQHEPDLFGQFPNQGRGYFVIGHVGQR